MNVVKIMWLENDTPARDGDTEIRQPTLEQILDGISGMDGDIRSYVMLFPGEEPHDVYLVIGGGKDGKFVVDHWDGDTGVEHNLLNPAVTSDERVEVVVAHASLRRANRMVDLATAREVATVYATGQLAPGWLWNKV